MSTRVYLFTAILLIFSCKPETGNQFSISSPNGSITLSLNLEAGKPTYSVMVDGVPLIRPSALGYQLRGIPDLVGPFSVRQKAENEIEETWSPVWGQEKQIYSHSNQLKVELVENRSPNRSMNLFFRVFDDGIGFRYEIPDQEGLDSLFISSELTEFNFAENANCWWIPADYNSYEKVYTRSLLGDLLDSLHTPLTMETPKGHFISIHEANLTNYPSMTLKPSADDSLKLICDLVPWPDGDKVKAQVPMLSPWRTIMIGSDARDLLASRLILNLNEPNRLDDVSWIKPMKYIGIWWGLHIGKETWVQGEHHGATTENTKRYIDFAAENSIQGVLVEGWNHDWERYGQDRAFKFTQPYDDFDIAEITRYAKLKHVSLIGHHETGGEAPYYDEQLEDAFAFCRKYGISAVKTGYARTSIEPIGETHHGQWMVQHYRRVVEMAAKYKVALNVHEPVKPTGLSRTWPHMMSREGARGMEWNAWSEGNPPSHTCILPFTRLLAGPLDYTPGIFDLEFNQFKPDNRVHTTLAKQLALMVVIYSPLQMAADLIENYEGQPAFQFVRDLNIDWDETRYLKAEIGEQVAIARRHGEEWFLGAITNEKERDLRLPLDEILDSVMVAECYTDAGNTNWESNPYPMLIKSYLASPSDTLRVKMAPGGGLAIRFRPLHAHKDKFPSITDLRRDQFVQNL
ncbi:MAG: glycoside hydrolase family 97 protein [Candidatus Marinimicrobia bacterium]|nr:glycoside hydrolase family 97 protein [Candidatus Neomarinimicrobiota bacterium]